MSPREPVIIDAVRTPIGRREGAFKDVRPDDLGSVALNALLDRTKIDPSLIEDLVIGCVTQRGEQGGNVARMIGLSSGLPVTVAGTSVNRLCGSGQQAVNFAAQEVLAGVTDVAVAGGVESMTREPMGSDVDKPLNPKMMEAHEIVWQGESAERIAEKWDISRQQLDEFSLSSHAKLAIAQDEGRFNSQITPFQNGTAFENDEGLRRGSTLEKLGSLSPSFRPDGRVTAANSSQISDGAAMLLVTTREKADELGLKPRARFVTWSVAGVDPTIMLTGPIPATEKVLAKSGLTLDDIDIYEVNEAFASVPIAWGKELDANWEKLNVNGGAIAHGHPLGATGAILMTKAINELERIDGRYALITMCIGFGQGIATIIERV
jgi:acetyl-CoA acetyltransferase family protein